MVKHSVLERMPALKNGCCCCCCCSLKTRVAYAAIYSVIFNLVVIFVAIYKVTTVEIKLTFTNTSNPSTTSVCLLCSSR